MNPDLRDFAEMDRVIHEPARLLIVTILYAAESVDFLYLLRETGLSKGNISTHMAKLEQAEYLVVDKRFRGKIPHTVYRLTDKGRAAFETYHRRLKRIVDSAAGIVKP
ncbi:MAG: transcriptional regulator [Acidobacteria bacterium]|nr:MAG: transcriptional regulator [Acidobacteriota bacterium]